MSWPVELRRACPDGLLIGVATDDGDAPPAEVMSALAREERTFADALPDARRRSWVAGRYALRSALAELAGGSASQWPPLLPNDRGAPTLPAGFVGSITHKPGFAAALVRAANPDTVVGVGVDAERAEARRIDISERVLTPDERAQLAAWPPEERSIEVLARFSAKEALYKAIDPFLRRYVGFQEVEVVRSESEVLSFTLRIVPLLLASGHQWRHDRWWISTATALRAPVTGRG